MTLDINNPNPYGILTEERLKTFESKLSIRLPEDYRKYLLKYNGGKTEKSHFYISEEPNSIDRIADFYGLNDGPDYQRLDVTFEIVTERIPKFLLPFANDPFGNQLCIAISGDEQGKIYFWNHEAENLNSSDNGLKQLSDSFNDFVENLISYTANNYDYVLKAIKEDNVIALDAELDNDLNIESEDEHGRTMIETAAIFNSVNVIKYLFKRGSKLRDALKYAEDNAQFFEAHKRSVDLIKSLLNKNDS